MAVLGFYDTNTQESGLDPAAADTQVIDARARNIAIGGFTGTAGLPGAINNAQGWVDFAEALLLKTSEAQAAALDLDIVCRRFAGVGGTGDDVMLVDARREAVMLGRDGDDSLASGGSDDTLEGGNGDDTLSPGRGNDVIIGGGGIDTLSYAALKAGVAIDLQEGTQNTGGGGVDDLSGIENVVGGSGADSLSGDAKANHLDGGGGFDVVAGGGGADTLWGGGGQDQLVGGAGQDVMDGGAGDDRFVYYGLTDSRVGKADRIAGLQNGDIIDVSAIDADNTQGGDQAFVIGGDKLSGVAGEIAIKYRTADDVTVFLFDVNGDGKADMVIEADGDRTGYDNFAL